MPRPKALRRPPPPDWLNVALNTCFQECPGEVLDHCWRALGARKLALRQLHWPSLRPVAEEVRSLNARLDLLVAELFRRQYAGLYWDPGSLSDQRHQRSHPLL